MTLAETRQLVADLWNAGPAERLAALRMQQSTRKLAPHELAEVVNLTTLSIRVRQAIPKQKQKGS